jgi:DNA-directed RNA polymerase subunit K/omega
MAPAAAAILAPPDPAAAIHLGRFHIASLTFQRAKQLKAGARPRVEGSEDHGPTRLALMEVMADQVTWDVIPVEPPRNV